ncbi:MAG: hypothetical protein JWR74_1639 [Polaromonas sp.]|jgi:hypothetical protein|nr:hypothetical protein [Polaromonas sp.]
MSNPLTQTTSTKNMKYTRVGDIASGRAGDKGDVLDLTLVARDDAAYEWLARTLTADAVRRELNRVVSGPVQRFEIAGLRALKYVLPQALGGGVYASLRPGLHWQKAAIWLLLDLMIEEGSGHVAWQQNL